MTKIGVTIVGPRATIGEEEKNAGCAGWIISNKV